jgi:hypothetical protein
MFDFGSGGNFFANLDSYHTSGVSAGAGFDRRGCTGWVRNYVISRIS